MMKYKTILDSDGEHDDVEKVTASVIRDVSNHVRYGFYGSECEHYDVRKSVIVGGRRIDARFTLDVTGSDHQ